MFWPGLSLLKASNEISSSPAFTPSRSHIIDEVEINVSAALLNLNELGVDHEPY